VTESTRARARRRKAPRKEPVAAPARIPVLFNGSAGPSGASVDAAQLRALFAAHGIDVDIVDAGASPERAARQALARQPRMIVAAGGDGTVSAVARVAVDTGTPLGILPLGTLNHFARDLGIPDSLETAIATLASGRIAAIDVGEVNGQVFVNNSSIGLYPRLVRHRTRLQHRLGRSKWRALLRATLTVLHRYPLVQVVVEAGARTLARRTPLVFVGNNAYAMHGLEIGHRTRLDTGLLSLYIPRRAGRLALFAIAIRALFGRSPGADEFDSVLTPALRIFTRRSHVHVALDGETTSTHAPLVYRIRPRALQVIVPSGSTDGAASAPG